MTKLRTNKKAHTLRGAAAFITAVFFTLAAMAFTACKQPTEPTSKYKVTFSVDRGGTLTAKIGETEIKSGNEVEANKTVTFTATPDAGYKVKGWTLDGKAVNGTDNSYQLKIEKAVTVKVSFEALPPAPTPKHAITFNVEGSGGTLKAKADGVAETETSPINVEKDKTVTFTATPNTDYMVDTWTVTPSAVLQEGGTEGSTTAKVKITEATTVKVSFTKYKKIAYGTNGDDLKNYLTTASPASDGIYYIEVAALKPEHLKGTFPNPGTLGQILKDNPAKKVALKLPKTVEGLTDMSDCFQECASLVQVRNIPEGVTNIHYCFMKCSSLTEAPAIPNKVTDMTGCFKGCSSLTAAPVIPGTVTNMMHCFARCTSLTAASAIPAGVDMMYGCFEGCTSLTQAPEIPSTVQNMTSCFDGCKNLTTTPTIQSGLTKMETCFKDCTSLTIVPAIPSSVTVIYECFSGCSKLTSVTLKCNYVDNNFNNAFEDCTALGEKSIKVPQAYYGNYTTADVLEKMKVPGTDETEKRAKFEGVAELNP